MRSAKEDHREKTEVMNTYNVNQIAKTQKTTRERRSSTTGKALSGQKLGGG